MLNSCAGYIVESDAEGLGDWVFCAFFVYSDDAVEWAQTRAMEPTKYRIRPQVPALQVLSA